MKYLAILLIPALVFLLGLLLASGLLIHAYGADINSSGMEVPTQDQILKCRRDAERFCGEFLGPSLPTAMGGNGYAILHSCMQANERKLSPRCKEAFK